MQIGLTKFACLACRKVFKRPADATRKTCPHCHDEARRVGSDFKAPSKSDVKSWEVASFLIRSGFPFYRLGVAYPTTLADAQTFIDRYADKAVHE